MINISSVLDSSSFPCKLDCWPTYVTLCERPSLGIIFWRPRLYWRIFFKMCFSADFCLQILLWTFFVALFFANLSVPPQQRWSGELSFTFTRTIRWFCFSFGDQNSYDAVSDLMHNWVPQRPDFKSALRVVEMVLNTQCYQYLWLTMWFHAKKSKETLKNSKSLILQCKFGSRAQKWPKIAKKTGH